MCPPDAEQELDNDGSDLLMALVVNVPVSNGLERLMFKQAGR